MPSLSHSLTLEKIFFENIKKKPSIFLNQGLFNIKYPMQHSLLMKIFLRAVCDDETELVKQILAKYPELLITEPIDHLGCRLIIESAYTWQTFYAEKALTMAVKRKQIKMINLLLSYFDQLELKIALQHSEKLNVLRKSKTEALSAWLAYEINNTGVHNKIIIPPEYSLYFKTLVNVFTQERFIRGKLSTETKNELHYLFKMLLPDQAIKLDDYIDVELFLLAAYAAYNNHFDEFLDSEQRSAFCIYVIGLIQSVLTPETAKIFCEGIHDVVVNHRKISERSEKMNLARGEFFYRFSQEAGLGFDSVCAQIEGWAGWATKLCPRNNLFEKLCLAKITSFENITQPSWKRSCVIL